MILCGRPIFAVDPGLSGAAVFYVVKNGKVSVRVFFGNSFPKTPSSIYCLAKKTLKGFREKPIMVIEKMPNRVNRGKNYSSGGSDLVEMMNQWRIIDHYFDEVIWVHPLTWRKSVHGSALISTLQKRGGITQKKRDYEFAVKNFPGPWWSELLKHHKKNYPLAADCDCYGVAAACCLVQFGINERKVY